MTKYPLCVTVFVKDCELTDRNLDEDGVGIYGGDTADTHALVLGVSFVMPLITSSSGKTNRSSQISQNVNIFGVTSDPGHGISIGSLGNKPNKVVKDGHVKNCTLIATQNGMRIKTWASSNVGEAAI
ncbi:polygalacturonase-like [Solanum stenotomum]|uniref:polygalacturonase-like n=1 Tax=Solanum stenotomum TaxID=172797 RepID=UPI0020D05C13|nr:polygalacturonase-like [Solanum stenotomum]